jgi:hypothetical protein
MQASEAFVQQRFGVMAGSVLRMTVLWWVQMQFFDCTFVLKIRHYAKPKNVMGKFKTNTVCESQRVDHRM